MYKRQGLSDPFTLQAGKNYYGYTKTAGEGEHILVADPLYLIRNVARIDFTGLSLDMTRAAKDVYVEGIATIVPECVFIMHGRTKSNAADMGNGNSWWNVVSNTVWGNVSATYAANATDYASGYRGDFVNDDAMFTNMRGSIIEGYKASLPATALVQNIATEDGVSATITIAPKFYVFENPQVKAAREMKERIARQVGDQARYLWMGTFHSIFSRILRCEAQAVGFTSNFTIYDSSDSKSLIKSIVKEMQLDDKTYKPGVIQARISNAKNHLVFPDAYVSNAELYQYDLNAKVPATRDIYRRYWERCRQSDAMDFDDLLVYTYMLFRDHPEICRKYAEQFRYVLVDEYQDTNFAQHSIVLQLTQEHQRVCVVGDDAQSIYSFRGANIDNILKFTQLYKGAKLFKLEQNYRSTQTIVCAANSLIEKNSEQIRTVSYTHLTLADD